MAFNTIFFICIFLPIFILIYRLSPNRFKGIVLTLGSLFFYSFFSLRSAFMFTVFVIILYVYTIILIKTGHKKWVLAIGLIGLIAYLVYYKYLGFFTENLANLLGTSWSVTSSKMPLGVSFYTFTSISLIVDVYRSKIEKIDFLTFLNFLTFFPKVVSGPLVRFNDFVFTEITSSNISSGLSRFIVGLSKKVVFAHYFGLTADTIWENLHFAIDTPSAWIGAIAYTLQIYFDFSGYSDMAIGISEMLGYQVKENFNFPYLATSITDFWRRWHISLGSWFRDYIYFPLGGSKKGNTYLNIFIVFLITGLWHGASWAFILWGIWHGLIRIMEYRLMKTKGYSKIPSFAKWIFTMLVVIIGWVLFRSADLNEGFAFLKKMFGFNTDIDNEIIFTWKYFLNNRVLILGIVGILTSTLFGMYKMDKKWLSLNEIDNKWLHLAQTLILVILMVINIMMILSSGYTPFIYFQF